MIMIFQHCASASSARYPIIFLTASKLARSGPTSDKIVGVFRTFVQTALHYIVIIHIVFVTVVTVVLTVAVTVCDCL